MTYGTPSRPGTILSVSIALLALFGGPAVIGAALGARGEAAAPTPRRFAASDACLACHNGLVTPSGEDVSIGSQWRASIMANSARDPYWQAAVRREIMDFPMAADAIQDECSVCHMPMSRTTERAAGGLGRIFAHLPIGKAETELDVLAADGVSCTLCHQVEPDNFGTESSFTGGFIIDTTLPFEHRKAYGPFVVDTGRASVMHSATGFIPTPTDHLIRSELCATCHTLYTHPRGPDGEVIGRFPEQVPYLEWLESEFRGVQSCQDCHMGDVVEEMPISSVLGQPRPGLSRHVFTGGNSFMLRVLDRYRDELGVIAPPDELEASARRTDAFLQTESAELVVEAGVVGDGAGSDVLEAVVTVRNLTGHKLPTAYPSRRAWLHVTVLDAAGAVVFESGAVNDDASIVGNDNDADPTRYEPHYEVIDSPDQVQIYEPILVGPQGQVTTGLLTAVDYAKDNRLLPRGFDKATAHPDAAVHGRALADPDFVGGEDRVRYRIEVSGRAAPFRVEAKLWYQPIGFRWAHNLERYDAPETRRFLTYYASLTPAASVVLARASAIVPAR